MQTGQSLPPQLNMRAELHEDQMSGQFSKELLDVGDGTLLLDEAAEISYSQIYSIVIAVYDVKAAVHIWLTNMEAELFV